MPPPSAPALLWLLARSLRLPTLRNRDIYLLHAAAAVAVPRTGVLDLATVRWVYGRTAPGCKLRQMVACVFAQRAHWPSAAVPGPESKSGDGTGVVPELELELELGV